MDLPVFLYFKKYKNKTDILWKCVGFGKSTR